MKLNKYSTLMVWLLTAALVGCSSSPPKRIDAGGANALTTMGADVRDFKSVAGELTQSLLAAQVLSTDVGRKPVISVGQVRNDTAERFDTDQVTFKITTDILNSGKAQIAATDAQAVGLSQENARAEQRAKQLPDYVLYAKILQTSARQGDYRENTFTLQFTLADAKTGNTVWQSEKDFAKQGKRSSVGF